MRHLIWIISLFISCFCYSQNVGIGNTLPQYKLDVSGTGGFTGNALDYSLGRVLNGALHISNTNGNGQVLKLDGSNIQSTYSNPGVIPAQLSPRPMTLNPFGGNVGIGTNFTPEYKLHLWASNDQLLKIDGNNSLVIFNDNTSNAQFGFFRTWTSNPFNPAGYYGFEIGTPPIAGGDPPKQLMFSTNYQLRMVMMEDGKTGINTVTPNSRLEVGGSLSLPIRTVVSSQDGITSNLGDDDYTLVCDMQNLAVSGRVLYAVLPPADTRKGRIYNITAINLGNQNSNLDGGVKIYAGSLGGILLAKLQWFYNSSTQVTSFNSRVTLQSDGTNWIIINSDYHVYKF